MVRSAVSINKKSLSQKINQYGIDLYDKIHSLTPWGWIQYLIDQESREADKEFMKSAVPMMAGRLCAGDTVYVCNENTRQKHTFLRHSIYDLAGANSGTPFRKEYKVDTYTLYNSEDEKFMKVSAEQILWIAPRRKY